MSFACTETFKHFWSSYRSLGVHGNLVFHNPGKHHQFLALLDYVSKAHEIKIRPSSVRPSVVRLWHQLSLNLLHGFLSNFGSCYPWAIWPDIFWFFFFLNNFWSFLRKFFVFANMGSYGIKNFKTLLLPQITFESIQNFFLNLLLSGPHKSTVLDFWNFEFTIFHNFLPQIPNTSIIWKRATVERNGVNFGPPG